MSNIRETVEIRRERVLRRLMAHGLSGIEATDALEAADNPRRQRTIYLRVEAAWWLGVAEEYRWRLRAGRPPTNGASWKHDIRRAVSRARDRTRERQRLEAEARAFAEVIAG